MPNLPSAKKRARQNEKRRLRNKSHKSAVKTQIKKLLKAINEGDVERAKKEFPKTISMIDKIAQKGIWHPNKSARKKSRIYKKYNQFLAQIEKENKQEDKEEKE